MPVAGLSDRDLCQNGLSGYCVRLPHGRGAESQLPPALQLCWPPLKKAAAAGCMPLSAFWTGCLSRKRILSPLRPAVAGMRCGSSVFIAPKGWNFRMFFSAMGRRLLTSRTAREDRPASRRWALPVCGGYGDAQGIYHCPAGGAAAGK